MTTSEEEDFTLRLLGRNILSRSEVDSQAEKDKANQDSKVSIRVRIRAKVAIESCARLPPQVSIMIQEIHFNVSVSVDKICACLGASGRTYLLERANILISWTSWDECRAFDFSVMELILSATYSLSVLETSRIPR